jgi:hypothetical protein
MNMKPHESIETNGGSPWPIIRWMAAVVIYGLTIAIGFDLMGGKTEEIQNTQAVVKEEKSKTEKVQAELRAVQKQCRKAETRVQTLEAGLDEIKALHDKAKAAYEAHNQSLQSALLLSEIGNKATRSSPPPMQMTAAAPVRSSSPAAGHPLASWIPPQMHMQAKEIKDRAVSKWKDDHSMVAHEIKKQTEAIEKLRELNRATANKQLLAWAGDKWPDDFAMMVYEFEKQAKAQAEINAIR